MEKYEVKHFKTGSIKLDVLSGDTVIPCLQQFNEKVKLRVNACKVILPY
jgi:hypothetical protein